MHHPIETPAAWKGDELLQRDDFLHELNGAQIADIKQAFRLSQSIDQSHLTPATFQLSVLADKLHSLQRSLEEGSGAALIRGLPLDNYSEADAARLLYGLTSYIGTAVSQSTDGLRVFPVQDERYGDSHPKARGPSSRKRLSYHTDRCDVIAFLCVRQALEGGENYLVSSVAVYNEMLRRRPDLLDVLMQPYRYQRHNVDTGNQLPYYEQPVFSFREGHFAASLLRVLIERAYNFPGSPPMTDVQREALDYIDELADDPSMHVCFRQQPGDIVLLNNWVTLHRRSEFVDHQDLQRRRLLWRIWLSVPNSRPIDPRFSASYGATDAGAIRGGMQETN